MQRRTLLKAFALSASVMAMGLSFQAYAADTIKVGIMHSLSGTMAISETPLKDVALMAIDDINAKGGVLGKKLEPVVVDPASNWPLFAEKARQLLAQDKVAVVFGCWTSVSRKSVLPVFEELNGLLFYPVQYEGEEMSPNVFYTGAAPNPQLAPQWLAFYPLVALPVAFLVTAGIGMALERTIIRHLYGRPLETLLATWGISLMLIQLVRMLFGAQNVEVANPAWLSGGVQVLPNLILPWNRLAVLAFVLLVLCFTWLILNRTRLGMNVRAVTQNRAMAACCGVPTGRVDMLAFGLGSGIAGLGGVALSQLGNVGPELGQGYIIDSFLVVVLGGVGQLAGSVAAAFGLGIFNKILEPQMGAVLGKILILVMIILFIQKRPQGLFALKGRVID